MPIPVGDFVRIVYEGHHFDDNAIQAFRTGLGKDYVETVADMRAIVWNDRVDAGLTVLFVAVVVAMVLFGLRAGLGALRADRPTVHELPGQAVGA